MEAIVLVKGTESKRLGVDKAFIKIHHIRLIELILNKIMSLFEKVCIVSLFPEKFEIYSNEKVKILKDELDCGPVGGIYTGLLNSNSLYSFVFPVDLPFMNVTFIKYMMKIEKDYDVLCPCYKDKIEVLFAIYKRDVLSTIKGLINERNYRVRDILKKVKTKYIGEDEIERFGGKNMFFNLNTLKDFELIKQVDPTQLF